METVSLIFQVRAGLPQHVSREYFPVKLGKETSFEHRRIGLYIDVPQDSLFSPI